MAKARQHTVSAFLLDRFASDREDGRRVCMLPKATGTPKWVSPRDVTVRRHFYSIDTEQGQRSTDVEDLLAMLEGDAARLVRDITAGAFPVREERLKLALYLAACWLRTPVWREQMASIIEQATTNMYTTSLESDPAFPHRALANEGLSVQEIEAIRVKSLEGFKTGDYYIEAPKNMMIGYFLKSMSSLSWVMFMLDWTAIQAAEDDDEFVIADTPVSLHDPRPYTTGAGLLTSPDVQVFLPTGPTTGILLEANQTVCDWARDNMDTFYELTDAERAEAVDDREGRWAEATPTSEFVKELNLRTYAHADRYIFGSQRAVQATRTNAKNNPQRLRHVSPRPPRMHIFNDIKGTATTLAPRPRK